ncbi:MAG: hypothetical protein Q7R33_01110, partial [Nitrosarchaeum sp.]|nr:hypothetical protein [Nitrosarchaeum sp.]
ALENVDTLGNDLSKMIAVTVNPQWWSGPSLLDRTEIAKTGILENTIGSISVTFEQSNDEQTIYENIDSSILASLESLMNDFESKSYDFEKRLTIMEDVVDIAKTEDKVEIVHDGGMEEITQAIQQAFIDVPIAFVQSIWATGDSIVQGIRKTYYDATTIASSIGHTLTSWSAREIEISQNAPEEIKDRYAPNKAQAADNSKVDFEETDNGAYLATYGVDSTRGEIFINGEGELIDGQARIFFDKSFSDIIDHDVPLRVMVTPTSYFEGSLYVADKTPFGFTVNEIHKIDRSVKFDWLVIARRKGYGSPNVQTSPSVTPNSDLDVVSEETQTPEPTFESTPISDETPEPTPEISTPVQTPILDTIPEQTSEPTPEPTPEISTPEITPESTPILEEIAEPMLETPTPEPTPEISIPEITPEPTPESTPEPAPEPTLEPAIEDIVQDN